MIQLSLNHIGFYFNSLTHLLFFVFCFFFYLTSSAQFIDVSNHLLLETNHVAGYLGSGVSFVDFNNDGIDDLTFGDSNGAIKFYQCDGESFEQIDLGIEDPGAEVKSVSWVDIDNDGDLDFMTTNRLSPNKLWRNDSGEFVDISSSCGLDQSHNTRSYGVSFGDYNNDGFIDFYICNYHTWIDSKENELYMNNGDGTFYETTEIAGVGNGFQQSFQSTFIDINDDGLLDLHVINDRLDMFNAFYMNNGDGTFTDKADEWNADLGILAMSSSFGDYDRDGDLDLYVTNGYDGNVLLENQILDGMGSFVDMTMNYGVGEYELCWGADWIDYDNDGYLDLYVSSGIDVYSMYPDVLGTFPEVSNSLYSNDGMMPFSQSYSDLPQSPQHTFAVASGDFNNDGFPDIVSHRLGTYASFLKGTPSNNKWLKVKLVGVNTNTLGIGCEIEVNVIKPNGDMQSLHEKVISGENYLGQNSYTQIFGLSNSVEIESVVVYWTGGEEEYLGPFDMNSLITLVEGETDLDGNPSEMLGGCTYEGACNYVEEAVVDSGDCDFSCLCGDGTVWDISQSKCVANNTCPTDVNSNGTTEVGDLLMILATYGFDCSE